MVISIANCPLQLQPCSLTQHEVLPQGNATQPALVLLPLPSERLNTSSVLSLTERTGIQGHGLVQAHDILLVGAQLLHLPLR